MTINLPNNNTNDPSKIRVQFDDFELKHFDIAPIWEFAIDEEGEEGQDETTLRPIFDATIADPADGLCIVKVEFQTSSGKIYFGLCSPAFDFKFGEIQPCMFTDKGILSFWCGMMKPERLQIENLYAQFEETKDTLFPIKFKSLTKSKGAALEGQIDGFMFLENEKVKIIN